MHHQETPGPKPRFAFSAPFPKLNHSASIEEAQGKGNEDGANGLNTLGPNICAFKGRGLLAPTVCPPIATHPNQHPGSLNVLASIIIEGL